MPLIEQLQSRLKSCTPNPQIPHPRQEVTPLIELLLSSAAWMQAYRTSGPPPGRPPYYTLLLARRRGVLALQSDFARLRFPDSQMGRDLVGTSLPIPYTPSPRPLCSIMHPPETLNPKPDRQMDRHMVGRGLGPTYAKAL